MVVFLTYCAFWYRRCLWVLPLIWMEYWRNLSSFFCKFFVCKRHRQNHSLNDPDWRKPFSGIVSAYTLFYFCPPFTVTCILKCNPVLLFHCQLIQQPQKFHILPYSKLCGSRALHLNETRIGAFTFRSCCYHKDLSRAPLHDSTAADNRLAFDYLTITPPEIL